jgi:ribosome-binding protein aMBF1 (putative translation factor)
MRADLRTTPMRATRDIPSAGPADAVRSVGPNPAARVRAARAAADLSREDLGRAIGLSARTVRRLEDGQRRISPQELRRIAATCDVPEWFLAHGWQGWERLRDR